MATNSGDGGGWRIGARASLLAQAQAEETARRLRAAHGLPPDAVQIVPLSTRGDQIQDRPLAQIGGKGLFTKELDEALLDGRIDLAAHSMKDVPTAPPDGIEIVAVLPREDPRDAFLSHRAARLEDLSEGAVVGVSSLRRQAQTLARRPDLRIAPMRGNVQTRLKKLADGLVDATYLAMAGLNRLGQSAAATRPMSAEEMLPAAAQGAICVAARAGDAAAAALCASIECAETRLRVAAERAFLARLDGSCQTPIAALAELSDGALRLRGELLSADGAAVWRAERVTPLAGSARAPEEAAAALGVEAAEAVLTERDGAAAPAGP